MQAGTILGGVAALTLAGCGARAVVNEPSKITLQQALEETVDALFAARYRSAQHGGVAIGLNACTVTATFNVTATNTDKQGLVLNVGAPAGAPITAGIQGSLEATASATRGNIVVVTFTSPACNPADTLGTKSPNDVAHLQWQIGEARYGGYPAAESSRGRSRRGGPDLEPLAHRGGGAARGSEANPLPSAPPASPPVQPSTPSNQDRRPWDRPDMFTRPQGFRPDVSRLMPNDDPILLQPPPPSSGGASAPTVGRQGTPSPGSR